MAEERDGMTMELMEREQPLEKPENMDEMAQQADKLEGMMFQAIAPEGEFSASATNTFIKGLNEALKLFPGAEPEEQVTEKIDGAMPEAISRKLGMVLAAYSDYSGDEQMAMSEISSDRDLKEMAGKLLAYSKDKAFRAFLAKPMGEDDMRIDAIKVEVETEAPTRQAPEGEEDDLLMSRMS
jgi:hypothetical protein